ncbi:DUF1911 domain-containing protein [Aquincola sp. S2]|uniref:DUF1911 domain-containing protein n=2 Tax=Pseudaquabacterium terrae TaxID=2732868 RepID=A0ABX2ELC8_9BURK|nr:DUF1911 domain-containing protein [Aquabacterium terrae]
MDPSRPMGATRSRAWDAVTYLHLQYTAGMPVDRLRQFLPDAVAFWTEFAAYDKAYDSSPAAGGRRVPHIDLHDKDYWNAIRLTSFAILFGQHGLLPSIAPLWDYENEEMDGLLERLIAPFVPGRAPPPDTCTRHLPYFKLLKVLAADPDKRSALMAKYMDEWYVASRREPYYESHTKGREHSFLGYWSFEAAAVAYVLDIDDTTFRDHEFYPRDLADFARSLPRPVVLGGPPASDTDSTDRLRCTAGQPCPRSGFWFTPARPDSRRQFAQGDVMPELGGDYGATIWQWDDR